MKNTLKLASFAAFAVVLSLVMATGSPARSTCETCDLGDETLTIRELLGKWNGAQAFVALTELAEARCPRLKRLLDRKKASLVVLVPSNPAIAEWLRIDKKTFAGLEIDDIVDAGQERGQIFEFDKLDTICI